MKKLIFLTLATVVLLLSCSSGKTISSVADKNASSTSANIFASSENNNSDVPTSTDSAIAILLSPYIDKAIQEYFGQPTQYALYDAKINSISQKGTDFIYEIVITVPTFQGAHNPPYGLETMSFTVKPGGSVTLNNYEHKNSPN